MERSAFDNDVHILHEQKRGVDPAVLEDLGYKMVAGSEALARDQIKLEILQHLETAANLSKRTAKNRDAITQHRIQAKYKTAEHLGLMPTLETDTNGSTAVVVEGEEREHALHMAWASINIDYSNDDPACATKRRREIKRLESKTSIYPKAA